MYIQFQKPKDVCVGALRNVPSSELLAQGIEMNSCLVKVEKDNNRGNSTPVDVATIFLTATSGTILSGAFFSFIIGAMIPFDIKLFFVYINVGYIYIYHKNRKGYMKTIGRTVLAVTFAVAMFVVSGLTAYALDAKSVITLQLSLTNDICPAVKTSIREGNNARETVKTAISMGYDVCYVIKCSFDAGGGLEETIFGAMEGGASSDICARCIVDAGASPEDVANILPVSHSGKSFVSPSGF